MTYATFESSVESSRPIECFRIDLGPNTYTWTSSEDTITLLGLDYEPEVVTRSKAQQSPENTDQTMELTFPSTNAFVRQYISSVPGSRALVTIRRVQRPDFPSPEVTLLFQGYVQSVGFAEDGTLAKVAVLPIASAMSRAVPRFGYQSQCNHVLYDLTGCKIDKTLFKTTATVSGASGNTITIPGLDIYPDSYYNAGFVEALGGLDARMILDHTGNVLTLLLPFPFTSTGQLMDVYAGCDHTIATCKTKFNNVINYGGFFFVPVKNPFEVGID